MGSDRVYRPLVERRVGDRWVIFPTPKLADDATLSGIAVAGPKDVWAVGWRFTSGGNKTLAEHFDGHHWHQVAIPGTSVCVGGVELRASDPWVTFSPCMSTWPM